MDDRQSTFEFSRSEPSRLPSRIPHRRKLEILSKLSEDDFRDRVVRPVFMRRGLTFLKDTCGPDEAGKDALFLNIDPLGAKQLYAVQTKKGKIHHNRKASDNVVTIITQLRTALEYEITDVANDVKAKPAVVILCASGEVSNSASNYIITELRDSRIRVMDANAIITEVDKHYPEFWAGVDAATFPYLHALQAHLQHASDTIAISELGIADGSYNPIADDTFIPLYLVKVTTKSHRSHGRTEIEPDIQQITVDAMARRPELRTLIIGDGGSGKTTALRRIADQMAHRLLAGDADIPIPVLLSANEIATSPHRLAETAVNATEARSKSKANGFSIDDLVSGRVALLIDAIDEVPADMRASFYGRISDFATDFPKCRIIVTSRGYVDITSSPTFRAFSHYQVSPISVRQAKKVINRLTTGRSLSADQAQETLRRLESVHGMELNPLLVTVFAASSDLQKSDIPPNITEIFSKFTELMLGRWDQGKGLKHQHRSQVKDFLLRRLAFEMHKAGTTKYASNDATLLLEKELSAKGYRVNATEIIDEAIHRSALLRFDGSNIEFRHHMLQEYFAGRGVPSAEFFGSVVANTWWRNPLVFYFGSRPEDLDSLVRLASSVAQTKSAAAFDSAVSIGLALQACYLGNIAEKGDLLQWVVRTLGTSHSAFAPFNEGERRPLMSFITGYLVGRDAVGCGLISDVAAAAFSGEADDSVKFWALAGLLEAGKLKEFAGHVAAFKPENRYALAALMMGCSLIAQLRITSGSDKKVAEEAGSELAKRIPDLFTELNKEFRSLLLEMRKGRVAELPEGSSAPTDHAERPPDDRL